MGGAEDGLARAAGGDQLQSPLQDRPVAPRRPGPAPLDPTPYPPPQRKGDSVLPPPPKIGSQVSQRSASINAVSREPIPSTGDHTDRAKRPGPRAIVEQGREQDLRHKAKKKERKKLKFHG